MDAEGDGEAEADGEGTGEGMGGVAEAPGTAEGEAALPAHRAVPGGHKPTMPSIHSKHTSLAPWHGPEVEPQQASHTVGDGAGEADAAASHAVVPEGQTPSKLWKHTLFRDTLQSPVDGKKHPVQADRGGDEGEREGRTGVVGVGEALTGLGLTVLVMLVEGVTEADSLLVGVTDGVTLAAGVIEEVTLMVDVADRVIGLELKMVRSAQFQNSSG